ncbi:FecR family protein [Paenibacillus sp. 1_12]|uniref:FecR family protein n=1 Tax=Paenibacillus sp. 1_12 TaxID=1566278 RepID=UPI0008E3F485|nr:FecR family protein [Paenibacillus sp. 1_12]SFL27454.1 FecR family protein [Paenibacillus sp. 1_12]
MGYWNRMRMGSSKSFLSLFVAFSMVFSLLSVVISEPIQAKSTRTAIVVNIKGNVTVKKSGGSKSYTAYNDMTLNQGDVISTGASSSVVVRIADHDDEITIGDNAEVSVTDLANEGNGKQSKISSWAGSMWVKVKTLVGAQDEFEVETPTATMGVKGTQFFTGVNPVTGETFVVVGAGAVQTTTTTYQQSDISNPQNDNTTLLLPTQQINLTGRDEVTDVATKTEIIDIFQFVERSSPELLEAIIKNKAEIDKENAEFIEKKKAEIAENNKADTGNSALTIKDIETLNKISKNLDNLIGNIIKAALDQKKIDPNKMNQIVAEANAKLSETDKKIDLNKVEPLDRTAGLDSEKEKQKQAELQKLKEEKERKLAEKKKLEQEQLDKNKAILDALAKEKQRLEEANKKTEEAAAKQAEANYINQLSTAEQAAFEQNKSANTPTTIPTNTTPGSGGGSSGGTSGGTTNNNNSNEILFPLAPALISPTQVTSTNSGMVQLKLRAALTTNINIFNGATMLASSPGQGDTDVVFNIPLSKGVYNLTAQTERFNRFSPAVQIPQITISSPADILLTQVGGPSNNVINLNLTLNEFVDASQFYGVEVHLIYNNSLSYKGPSALTDVPGTVFDGPNMAETLKEYPGSTQNELVYAASQFETAATTGTISNLSVNGQKILVTIPLAVSSAASNTATIDLVYVKFVNKAAATVYELGSGLPNAPKSISVTTR